MVLKVFTIFRDEVIKFDCKHFLSFDLKREPDLSI